MAPMHPLYGSFDSPDGHFRVTYKDVSAEIAAAVATDADTAWNDIVGNFHRQFALDRNAIPQIAILIGPDFLYPKYEQAFRTIFIPSRYLRSEGAGTGPEVFHARGPAIWHAVTNALLPSGQPESGWGTFLNEGLGVFVQFKYGTGDPRPWPNKVYPTFGNDLDARTLQIAREIGFHPMDNARQIVVPMEHSKERRLAWLQAGSFVKWLWDEKGLTGKYASWHRNPVTFHEAVGGPLEDFQYEWEAFVDPPPPPP